jgi:hypothetical protein
LDAAYLRSLALLPGIAGLTGLHPRRKIWVS